MSPHGTLSAWLTVAAVLAALTIVLTASGCARPSSAASTSSEAALADDQPLRIVVSIPPLAEVVRRLAPEGSSVVSVVQPGQSPHGAQASPSDLASIVEADLVVLVGLGLEGRMTDLLRRADAGKTVEFADVVDDLGDHAAHCNHRTLEPTGGEHASDPHLWLDPGLMVELVDAIGAHLDARGMPSARERAEAVKLAILDADARAFEALRPLSGSRLVTQHDAWSRFAAHYGLEVLGSVLPVGAGEASPGDVARAIEAIEAARLASDRPIGIFTEPQLNARISERVAKASETPLGVLDPLGDGDWFAMLEHNTAVLAGTLTPRSQ